jgi:phosphoribosylformimino-5-aminoimidazole carboxamide ribotide isomerase
MSVEIIPVIDLMGGIVVHAQGQSRDDYKPLKSILTQHIEPILVIKDLLALKSVKTLYIADLDAIIGDKFNIEFYKVLAEEFPQLELWLDAGIKTREQCRQLELLNIKPIIGSETLEDLSLLSNNNTIILSLDFKNKQFLGNQSVIETPSLWPEKVIVMNLDFVGANNGVDIGLIQKVKNQRTDITVIAAGGVRSEQDIETLQQESIKQVLVATALHRGDIQF